MSAALNSLLQRSSIDDHDQILKQCNETLKQNKNDIKTLHIKVVALLQLSRFNDAVRTFDQAGDDLKDEAILEYAYTLYKSGEALKAQDVVRKIESRAAKLLQAQIVG